MQLNSSTSEAISTLFTSYQNVLNGERSSENECVVAKALDVATESETLYIAVETSCGTAATLCVATEVLCVASEALCVATETLCVTTDAFCF